VLLAEIRPAAEARITMRLSDIPGGCRVAMTEAPPLRWIPDKVQLVGAAPAKPRKHVAVGDDRRKR